MRALLVIDMQEALLGKDRDKKYTYRSEDLIQNVNDEISKFDKENVYYIKTINKKNFLNKIFSKNLYEQSKESQFVEKLNIVGRHIFEKEGTDAFKTKELSERLKKEKIDEIQIAGIDVCGSIFHSVISGVKKGFKVVLNRELMDTTDKKKGDKLIENLKSKGVKVLN